ncbi:MAG: hypothetical protein DMG36_15475 [Acidobacteria bacterium]|nr:MAG: hypothetical protein DMG36_15475 [Acidobacteriota bacterium]
MDEVKSGKHNGSGNGNGNGNTVPTPSFSLRDLLGVVFRRKRLMLLCFAGLLSGAVLAIAILPAAYEAQMKILVERERVDPVVSPQGNVVEADRNLTPDEISSEVELFQSRDSLKQTVVDCGLHEIKNPWSLGGIKLRVLGAFGLAPDKDQRIFKAVLALEKDLHVIPMNNSNLIKVTYEARSPQTAEQVLTELGNLYLLKHAAIHHPQGTSEFFQQQADQYKNDLADAQSRLVKMNQQSRIVSADFEKQVTLQKLSDFDVSLQQTRAAVAETKQRVRALQEKETSIPSRVTTQIRTADNPQLMANLKTTLLNLEIKRTELLEVYEPSYPLVHEVEKQITQAVAAIADAKAGAVHEETTDQNPTHEWVRTEMAKAEADLVGLEARSSVLSGAVRTLQDRALKLDQQSVVQQELLRTAKADEDSYLLFRKKREEARIADALDQSKIVNVAVAEAAAVPLVPTGLPLEMKLILAVVIAALVSLGAGFVGEYLDPSFRTVSEVKEYLDIPLLATLPRNGHR